VIVMPELENSAQQGEDRRQGTKERRKKDKDRRDLERLANEIAPRRHPDIKGRRSGDQSSS